MSDPNSPGLPAAKARPISVTISSYLLMLFAALQVLGLAVGIAIIGDMRSALDDVFAEEGMSGAENIVIFALIGGASLSLAFAAGLVVLALFNNRGKNGSRITTWVVGGLMVCCGGLGLLGSAMSAVPSGQTGPSQDEIERQINEAVPSWYNAVSNGVSVIGLLALLAAMILLALPQSNEFFRKPQVVGLFPGSAYPAYPGYPQQPYGAPGYPQQPYGAPGYLQDPYGTSSQQPYDTSSQQQPGTPSEPGQAGTPSDPSGPSHPPQGS